VSDDASTDICRLDESEMPSAGGPFDVPADRARLRQAVVFAAINWVAALK
jgi:hypothetical protein